MLNKTLARRGLEVRLTDEAKRWIVDKTCADRSYGARPLRRALQKYVEDPLSEALIQGSLGGATIVEVYPEGNELALPPRRGRGAGRRAPDSLKSSESARQKVKGRRQKGQSASFAFFLLPFALL